MNPLQRALIRLQTDVRLLDLRWTLLGGLAVSVRAEPRTTRDVDIAVVVEGDHEAEQIVREFWSRGYRLKTPPLEHLDVGRMATVRFLAPGEDARGVVVDLLFASSGIESEVVAAADLLEVFPGVAAPVATTGHLLALKTLAGRDQDLADIQSLLHVADANDLQQAREALALISRRGFDRGKDLQVELARHLETAAKGP